MRTLRRLLSQHSDYRLVLTAGLISLTGDWILRTGLAYQVYQVTGSALASGGMLIASFLPQIVLGSVAGTLVDRWNRRRTMITTNLLLAAGLVPLLFVDRPERIWIVYAVMVWEGCVQVFFEPAEKALIPSLVDTQHLVTANALNAQTADLARLIGGAAGGVTAAWGGIGAVALLDLLTFITSAVLLRRIRTRGKRSPSDPVTVGVKGRLRQLRTEWADGLSLTWRLRPLQVVFGFVVVTSVGEGIMSTLFAPFVRDVLHGSGSAYGTLMAAQAVGGITGGLLTAVIGQRFPAARLWGVGALAFGAIDLALFCYPVVTEGAGIWPALACMIVAGAPASLAIAGLMTVLQGVTDNGVRGRVFGALGVVDAGSTLVGIAAGGALGEKVGIVPLLTGQGIGLVLGGFLVLGCSGSLRTPETDTAIRLRGRASAPQDVDAT
ncbi:MFS transporter [Streptomyces sp. NPDC023998]|uniref:MFS transporter n=1 Tax=Streptomyces sp. NPDC023998 TaxID=3154597 RepID=UPI0033F31C1E